ncbi:Chemotaxis methyl-accepting receptor HlyB-like 4HB MCP domain-containing protein [Rhodanobacter sp. Root179]|uniref:hypothetical protein n=1 Tax=Rhodanobacter sp. Root179 TaxID=1736482 RepID=UPI0006F36D66|nr:hypothetical protein [Rhodanobacter sp. Root179]KRB43949.1 hypothetical protein ASD82_06480 [Rhodanobacter sp. Root179]
MHLEVLKVRLHSLKDFAKHYLMIVLSILTALGLEAWIEHAHHRHAAAEASTQIEAEIRANLAECDTDLQHDLAQMVRLRGIRDEVTRELKMHTSDDLIAQRVLEQTRQHFDLKLMFPTLRHEAWDVMVANQSAGWIDPGRLQRYAVAYASQRDVVTTMSEDTELLMSGTGLVDTVADLRTDTVHPREFLHVVSQMTAMLEQAVNNLQTLRKQLASALPDTDTGAS